MALERPTAGSVSLMGRDLNRLPAGELRRARRDFQMVFQDPYGSLDPRQTIARIVAEPLTALGRVDRATLRERVRRCCGRWACVKPTWKIPARVLRRPAAAHRDRAGADHQPKLIVADEPVSALDDPVQAQVLNLLGRSAGSVRLELRPDQP